MSATTDPRQQFLNGEKPCTSEKDEKYDKIWDKISALETNPESPDKVTEEEIAYLFKKWDGNDDTNKQFIKYCVKNINKGDILCLAK